MDFTRSNSLHAAPSYNEGLRAFILAVYNFMVVGLVITGLVAYAVSLSPRFMAILFTTPVQWVVIFAPVVMVLLIRNRIINYSFLGAQLAFWIFGVLMGLSLSSIFLIYAGESIARAFFITSATFGTMSLYGYTTKRDLSTMGSFLIMGLVGVIIASLVNFFLQSSALHLITSIIALFIFICLTAYDTQKIKGIYSKFFGDCENTTKMAISGALALYIDFINIFICIVQSFFVLDPYDIPRDN